jgi:hypothetical protein
VLHETMRKQRGALAHQEKHTRKFIEGLSLMQEISGRRKNSNGTWEERVIAVFLWRFRATTSGLGTTTWRRVATPQSGTNTESQFPLEGYSMSVETPIVPSQHEQAQTQFTPHHDNTAADNSPNGFDWSHTWNHLQPDDLGQYGEAPPALHSQQESFCDWYPEPPQPRYTPSATTVPSNDSGYTSQQSSFASHMFNNNDNNGNPRDVHGEDFPADEALLRRIKKFYGHDVGRFNYNDAQRTDQGMFDLGDKMHMHMHEQYDPRSTRDARHNDATLHTVTDANLLDDFTGGHIELHLESIDAETGQFPTQNNGSTADSLAGHAYAIPGFGNNPYAEQQQDFPNLDQNFGGVQVPARSVQHGDQPHTPIHQVAQGSLHSSPVERQDGHVIKSELDPELFSDGDLLLHLSRLGPDADGAVHRTLHHEIPHAAKPSRHGTLSPTCHGNASMSHPNSHEASARCSVHSSPMALSDEQIAYTRMDDTARAFLSPDTPMDEASTDAPRHEYESTNEQGQGGSSAMDMGFVEDNNNPHAQMSLLGDFDYSALMEAQTQHGSTHDDLTRDSLANADDMAQAMLFRNHLAHVSSAHNVPASHAFHAHSYPLPHPHSHSHPPVASSLAAMHPGLFIDIGAGPGLGSGPVPLSGSGMEMYGEVHLGLEYHRLQKLQEQLQQLEQSRMVLGQEVGNGNHDANGGNGSGLGRIQRQGKVLGEAEDTMLGQFASQNDDRREAQPERQAACEIDATTNVLVRTEDRANGPSALDSMSVRAKAAEDDGTGSNRINDYGQLRLLDDRDYGQGKQQHHQQQQQQHQQQELRHHGDQHLGNRHHNRQASIFQGDLQQSRVGNSEGLDVDMSGNVGLESSLHS